MKRPFIFCHMQVSLNGKIMGKWMWAPEAEAEEGWFYDIAFGPNAYYHHQGWLSGRITTDDNFTLYKKPALRKDAPKVPDGDYAADTDFGMYYVSIDPHGKLGWEKNTLEYNDTKARVLEVLTEAASNEYKDFLRRLHIPYIIAGKDKLDEELLLDKLSSLYHIKTLMLGGGGILNWAFIEKGLCDELSLVVSPAADGDSKTQSVFTGVPGISDSAPVGFTLENAEKKGSTLWLRYRVNNAK